MNKTDACIQDILNGNTDLFSTLISSYQSKIYNFLYKMSTSKEEAEDMTQEVFIRVYNNLYKYDNRWSFSTWIYRIAINIYKSEYRKKKLFSHLIQDIDISMLECSYSDCPDVAYETKENRMTVIKLINKLKNEQKIVLILKHIQGFSYKEIGEILGISPDAAKMKVQRAKANICSMLEKTERSNL